jgi:class 3 adenylate cyclase
MFCEIVGAPSLSAQLDPEDFHDLITIYQETCTSIVHRFSGYIARQIGDALLAYFGYPEARRDAAEQAVRAGLSLIAALPELNARLQNMLVRQLPSPLQIRVGAHTGVAVVGEIGNKDYSESMALGETPNIAARLLTLANANTLVTSADTYGVIQDHFQCLGLGAHRLKGIAIPMQVYQVITARDA